MRLPAMEIQSNINKSSKNISLGNPDRNKDTIQERQLPHRSTAKHIQLLTDSLCLHSWYFHHENVSKWAKFVK